MAYNIPANTVRLVLDALKDVSGPQYTQLLTQAGWQRFLPALPPDSWEPIAAREELVRLFAGVYGMLGESATRLFLRNFGHLITREVLAQEWGRAMVAEAATIPPPARLAWVVQAIAQMTTQSWSPNTISEDATAWYLTQTACPICAAIYGTLAPLCVADDVLYGDLARQMLGYRLHVAEIECHAMGAAGCTFAFYKETKE